MNKNTFSLIFLVLITFSGCATTPKEALFTQAAPAPEKMGTLYVMRANPLIPMFYPSVTVSINNMLFATLLPKGYSYIYLPAGIYQVTFAAMGTETFTTEVEIVAGRESYELTDISGYSLKEIIQAQAPAVLKDYRFVKPINSKL